jgi:ABC-type nitrate/sulfonate/bicarbonate transport system substrate-binding protein
MRGFLRDIRSARVGVVGFMVAVALLSAGASQGATRAHSTAQAQSLVFAVGGVNTVSAAVYVAKAEGYFKKYGVDVRLLDNVGSLAIPLVAAGQADLAMLGPGSPLLASKQGRDMRIVFSPAGGGTGATLVGGKGITSIDQLRGKRIGTLSPGTSTYGAAVFYNQKYNLNADIVPLQTGSTIAGALASGQIQGATGVFSDYASLVANGIATYLIDTRNVSQRRTALGDDWPEASYFGMARNMNKKRATIVRFLAGIRQANIFMQKATDAKLAADLRKFVGFQTIDPAVLPQLVAGARDYWNSSGTPTGMITPATWTLALTRLAGSGLTGFAADDPDFTYEKRIDMSYLRSALKLVAKKK